MRLSKKLLSDRLSGLDPIYLCILPLLLYVFICAAFGSHPFLRHLHRWPSLLFFAVAILRPQSSATKKILCLPLLMTVWFIFAQFKQPAEPFAIYSLRSFFCVYFFAFPLAFLMQDGEKKNCLKLFSLAFAAGSLCLCAVSFLLRLNLLPQMLAEYVYWDGTRVHPFWHPNMAACLMMFGIGSCLAFLLESKKTWIKLFLAALILFQLVGIVLTNSRTITLMTAGLLGGTVFFCIVRGRWKLILPGLIAGCAVIALVFLGCGQLFQLHSENLLAEYASQTIPATQSAQGTFASDLFSFNSRTGIWQAIFRAIREDPDILLFGNPCPGDYIALNTPYKVAHAHNAWLECLLGLGIPGFAIAMVFTLFSLWNSAVILLKNPCDTWKRTIALLALCLMAAALMEPYLFLTIQDFHIFNFAFFLYIGYLAHWQEADNRKALQTLKNPLHK